MTKDITMGWLVALFLLLPVSVFAQINTATPVIPGYLSIMNCPGGNTPCFLPAVAGKSSLNITTGTVVKGLPGFVGTVCLSAAASSDSAVIDSTGTSVTSANTILSLPSTTLGGTCVRVDWPAATGIAVVPGTGGIMSISYQ